MNLPFENDAVTLAILLVILALIFHTSSSGNPLWKKFYKYVPAVLLCYFIPSFFNSAGIISSEKSNLYFVASRYLLPASLVLLTLSIDFKRIIKLGPKALIMTFTATFGVIIGGPVAVLLVSIFSPETVGGAGPDAVWRGLATVAGSWIGGSANQTAMKEIFNASDQLFSAIVTVDVFVYSLWMAFLLYAAGESEVIDKWLKADTSSIDELKKSIEDYHNKVERVPSSADVMKIIAVGLGVTGLSHLLADIIAPFFQNNFPELERFSLTSSFFWLVLFATTGGVLLSFTKLRNLEGAGAGRIGTVFLYILIATIGMQMDVTAIFHQSGLILVLVIWMLIQAIIIFTVGKLIKAPLFFIAVGSQANIGGAASAPVVAAAFHPALATVGVLLAVLGYAVGTYGAWVCAVLMSSVAP